MASVEETRTIALKLHELGFIPLRLEPESKAAKHQGWQLEIPTTDTIKRTFTKDSNLGVRCGDMQVDGTCLLGIDVDRNDAVLIGAVERALGDELERIPRKRGKKGVTFLIRFDREQKTTKIKWIRDGNKPEECIDILCRNAQTVLPPSIHPDTKQPYRYVAGPRLDEIDFRSLPVFGPSLLDEIAGFCKNADDPIYALNDMIWAGVGGGGNTHDICVRAASSMVARHWTDDDIHHRLQRAKREACEAAGMPYDWPESYKVIQKWIDTAREKFGPYEPKKAKISHGNLADAFLEKVRPDILFDWARRCWFMFEKTHWAAERDPAVRHLIERFLPGELRNRAMIEGIERSLRDRPELRADEDCWDRDLPVLNTPGGTVDLKTGLTRAHSPADRISRCTKVSPTFGISGSFWEAKLRDWFGHDAEDLDYNQRLAGYFCTGETREHCIPLWMGPGGDGKSTLAYAYAYALGDYSGVATDTAFLETKYGQHSEELAMLRGLRLVRCSEMSGRWREDRIKQVSGGESITASYKHAHNSTFKPQFKLLVTANDPPRLKSVGKDMTRRFHAQKFVRGIKEIDREMEPKLEQDASIVLGWMIQGAFKYYNDGGLPRSKSVIAATAEYFLDNDWAQQWIDECTEVGEGFRMLQTLAYESLRGFLEGQGYPPHRIPYRPDFQRRLVAKGIVVKNAVVVKGRAPEPALVGLRLKSIDNQF